MKHSLGAHCVRPHHGNHVGAHCVRPHHGNHVGAHCVRPLHGNHVGAHCVRPLHGNVDAQVQGARRARLLLIIIILFTIGCPPGPGRPSAGTKLLEDGISELRESDAERAPTVRVSLEELAHKHTRNELADNALLEVGKSYLAEEKFNEAARRFKEVVRNYPQGDARYEARYLLGLSLYRAENYGDSALELSKVGRRDPHYVEASVLLIKAQLKQGEVLAAIKRYAFVRKLLHRQDQIRELEAEIRATMEGLDNAALEELVREAQGTPAGVLAIFLLGERAYSDGNFRQAQSIFTRFLAQYPNDKRASEARDILDEIDSVKAVNRRAIGIVLPLSGKWAAFGKRFLNGASLALGAFHGLPDSQFPYELYIVDSKSDPLATRRAVEKLCTEKKVIAIIGPVQGETAKAAAEEAEAYGVPIITLTQVEDVTKIGHMVFRNFVTPRDQARTLAWYSYTALGVRSFSILYPDHSYGQLFAKVFAEEISKLGGKIVLSQKYEPGQTDFRHEIRAIAREKRSIEALFIPDTYYAVASIAPQLRYYNVIRMQLLGSSSWNSPKLIEYVQPQTSTIEGAVFTDAFYAGSPDPMVRDFVRDFQSTFGYEPGIYEAMAYESARILAAMVSEQRVQDRVDMQKALAGLRNFPSFSGYLQAQPDRSFRRPLFMLQVRDGKIVDISTTAHF